MSQNIQVITESFLSVTVTSSITSFGAEKRFPKDLTVAALKSKLELITGGSNKSMKLCAYDKDNKLVCFLDNDDALLGSYPIDSGMRIHVEDEQLKAGEFDDISKVQKYEIPEEEYAKRKDTLRAFKEKNKFGQFDAEAQKLKEQEQLNIEEKENQKAASMKVGDRCEVHVPGQPARRGIVQYIGLADFKPGIWIGVQYDEPHGKNDGSVAGKRYFSCQPNYGGFVKPSAIEVGDFPEEITGLDEDEM